MAGFYSLVTSWAWRGTFPFHINWKFFNSHTVWLLYTILLIPLGQMRWSILICAHNHHPITWRIYLLFCFLGGTSGKKKKKKPACQSRRHKRCGFNPWVRKILWRKKWQPTPVLLPGKSHGQRSLVGYSLWGCSVGHDWSDSACTHTPIISWFPQKFIFYKNLSLPGKFEALRHYISETLKFDTVVIYSKS